MTYKISPHALAQFMDRFGDITQSDLVAALQGPLVEIRVPDNIEKMILRRRRDDRGKASLVALQADFDKGGSYPVFCLLDDVVVTVVDARSIEVISMGEIEAKTPTFEQEHAGALSQHDGVYRISVEDAFQRLTGMELEPKAAVIDGEIYFVWSV